MPTQPALLIMTELKMVLRHLRLFSYARELGIVPVLVFTKVADEPRLAELTADPAHPFHQLGDRCLVSAPTPDAVLVALPDLQRKYRIAGVMSCGEYFVETAAMVAELLGLPGSSWRAATISRNKLMQRHVLGDQSPEWVALGPGDRDRQPSWDGPLVVKPTRRMSSSGVHELTSAAELAGLVAQYPADEVLLVEQRVVGPEFSVESLVQAGQPIWSGITAKATNEGGGGFVETAQTAPAPGLSGQDEATLHLANRALLHRIGMRDGITHAEYRLAGGQAVLMEVAVRSPGDGVNIMWQLSTGRAVEDCLVDIALGRPTYYPQPSRRSAGFTPAQAAGALVDVRSSDVPVSWTVRDARWPVLTPTASEDPARTCAVLVSKLVGEDIGPLIDNDSRAVWVIVDAPLGDDIEQEVKRARDGIDITVG